MSISASDVKELRSLTGAGIMDCKRALVDCGGNIEEAVDYLRKKGIAAAAKRSGRTTTDGIVGSYIHAGGKIGVLVEVNCETDFVAKTEDFSCFVKDLSMHIAASNPLYIERENIPDEVIEKEREIYKAQALESGKPEKIIDRIVDGKIAKYFKDVCLLEQAYVKDTDKTVRELIVEKISKLGENISVRRFVRYHLGEGLRKKQDDFVKEVAALGK
jgi:elongation factor Ts